MCYAQTGRYTCACVIRKEGLIVCLFWFFFATGFCNYTLFLWYPAPVCVQWDLLVATKRRFQIWILYSRRPQDPVYLMSEWRYSGLYFILFLNDIIIIFVIQRNNKI